MRTALIAALLLAGCGEPDPLNDDTGKLDGNLGIQVGDEGAFGCVVAAITPVSDPTAEIPELGRSMADAEAQVVGLFAGTGEVHDGTAVPSLTLNIDPSTAADWIETSAPDGSPTDSCGPYLRLELPVQIDGAPVVSASMEGVAAVRSDRTLLSASVDHAAVQGSLTPRFVDPGQMDWTDLLLYATPIDGDQGWEGGLGFLGCTDDLCSPPVDVTDPELAFTTLR